MVRIKCALCSETLTHVVKKVEVETGAGTATVTRVLADRLNDGAAPGDVVYGENLRGRARDKEGTKRTIGPNSEDPKTQSQKTLISTRVDNIPSRNVESGYASIEDLKAYGMVEDEERAGLGRRIAEEIKSSGRVRIWKMPSSLVGRDDNGRILLTGNPRTNYELVERIARVLGREIVWIAVGEVPRTIWSVAKRATPPYRIIRCGS